MKSQNTGQKKLAVKIWMRLYQLYELVKHQVLITVFGIHIACKHRPTCSQYCLKQINKNGTIGGSLRCLWRILRCW